MAREIFPEISHDAEIFDLLDKVLLRYDKKSIESKLKSKITSKDNASYDLQYISDTLALSIMYYYNYRYLRDKIDNLNSALKKIDSIVKLVTIGLKDIDIIKQNLNSTKDILIKELNECDTYIQDYKRVNKNGKDVFPLVSHYEVLSELVEYLKDAKFQGQQEAAIREVQDYINIIKLDKRNKTTMDGYFRSQFYKTKKRHKENNEREMLLYKNLPNVVRLIKK